MKRAILVSVASLILLTVAATGVAQTKKVTRKSGRALIGTVTKTDDGYDVRTKAGVVQVPADDVVSIVAYVSFEQEYSRRLLLLKSDDVEGHYRLALWCRGQKRRKEAGDELRTVLKIKPTHENAKLLLQLIEEELAEAARSDRPTPGRPVKPTPGVLPAGELIGEEDIYRVRLAELRSADKVSIAFRERSDRRFIAEMRGSGPFAEPGYDRVFLRKSPVAKAVDMLDLMPTAAELHDDILVRTNPQFMSTFKTRIWPIVSKQCATTQCHGSKNGAGRLKLYNLRRNADAVFFTNFLILDAFETNQGRMIDRSHPSRSLLLQYGLPQDIASAVHEEPIPIVYRSADVPRYRFVFDWISNELLRPHPKYNLKFRVPGQVSKKLFAAEPTETPEDAKGPAAPAGE